MTERERPVTDRDAPGGDPFEGQESVGAWTGAMALASVAGALHEAGIACEIRPGGTLMTKGGWITVKVDVASRELVVNEFVTEQRVAFDRWRDVVRAVRDALA